MRTVKGNGTDVYRCLSFWYHMYGPHVDALNIYIQKAGRLGPAKWSRFGTQGNRWNQGELTIKHNADIQVSFRGMDIITHGASFLGSHFDLAL